MCTPPLVLTRVRVLREGETLTCPASRSPVRVQRVMSVSRRRAGTRYARNGGCLRAPVRKARVDCSAAITTSSTPPLRASACTIMEAAGIEPASAGSRDDPEEDSDLPGGDAAETA